MTQEYKYSLTRVCLRRGEMSLSRSLASLFEDAGDRVEVHDTINDEALELPLRDGRVLGGLAGYFAAHDLRVNDTVVVRVPESGPIAFTARQSARGPDVTTAEARQRIIETVHQAGPVTSLEARALLPGLPADFDLDGLLRDEGHLELRGGRWRAPVAVESGKDAAFEREVDAALGSAAPQAPQGAEPAASGEVGFVGGALGRLGFTGELVGHSTLSITPSDSMTRDLDVLARVVAPGERLDWAELLELRRSRGTPLLAVFADDADLAKLSAPAELAQATLWSLRALENAVQLSESVPLCSVDMEGHFRRDGLYGRGLQRFERTIEGRIAERGAFSTVMANLAALNGPGPFRSEDVSRGVPPEMVTLILSQLERAPFQLLVRSESGNYLLRESVQSALAQMAEYARSLAGHMPRQSGEFVRR